MSMIQLYEQKVKNSSYLFGGNGSDVTVHRVNVPELVSADFKKQPNHE